MNCNNCPARRIQEEAPIVPAACLGQSHHASRDGRRPMTPDSSASSDPSRPSGISRFSELFEQHGRTIYGHIRTLVPNASDADEVFQETSVTLWQKFDQYRPEADFRAWACRIAYYKVLKLRDRQIRSPRLFSPEFLDLVSEEMIVMSDVLDARTEALLLVSPEAQPPRPGFAGTLPPRERHGQGRGPLGRAERSLRLPRNPADP